MNKGGLTISLIFDGMSLNYGEGLGIISELKKLSRSGKLYTYLSRQAIRYDIYKMLKEYYDIAKDKEEPLTRDQQVIQFKPEANVKNYEEVDLFGYMKTIQGKGAVTRPAVVRISPAISLEPFANDLEFGTNKNFADRLKTDPNPFQFEHHYSLYTYTITVDLDRIGEDPNDENSLEKEEKIKRVQNLLDVLKLLNRDIKGRTENLNPLFAIGGVYNVKNPFFLNRLKVEMDKNSEKYKIVTDILESTLNTSFLNEKVKDKTYTGYVKGFWANEEEFSQILPKNRVMGIEEFFGTIKSEVKAYYESA